MRRVNPLAKLLLYVVTVLLAATLLSPPIYWLTHGWHDFLANTPFRRFFSRTALVAALVLLWPTLRWMNVRSLAELGLARNPRAWADLRAGLTLATIPLLMLAAFYFGADIWRFRRDIAWEKIPLIFGTAAVVPPLEEFLFRGVLLGLAVRYLGRGGGAIVISLVFASVHFIDSRYNVEVVRWWSGFEILGHAFSNSGHAAFAFSGGVALFVLGLVFAFATLRTRSLWLAIGLHAGCIFGQQLLNVVAKFRFGKDPFTWMPWAGPNVVHGMVPTGLVPLAALLVIGALVWWYLRRVDRPPRESVATGVERAG